MGTLVSLSPLLGILAGLILTYLAKDEVKQGKNTIILLQHFLFGAVVTTALWPYGFFSVLIGALVFLGSWKFQISHTLTFIPVMGLFTVAAIPIPIFIYFIPLASIQFKQKKKLALYSGLYAIIALIFSIPF